MSYIEAKRAAAVWNLNCLNCTQQLTTDACESTLCPLRYDI